MNEKGKKREGLFFNPSPFFQGVLLASLAALARFPKTLAGVLVIQGYRQADEVNFSFPIFFRIREAG
jgi:hypothetical protein